jgi:hypothetical protein
MDTRRTTKAFWITLVVLSLLGCSGARPSPSASPTNVGGVATELPSVQPSASDLPVATPTATSETQQPTPTPRYRSVRWSTRTHVIFDEGCQSVVATIDESGGFHVAAVCSAGIGYASSADGATWKASSLAPPSGHFEVDPQLAADDATLYLAYTRMRPVDQDTCSGGDVNEDPAGIYYRTRALPGGRWSSPTRLRADGDHLQSFRVVDGVIHATFRGHRGDGAVSYMSSSGSTSHRITIPGAEATSLRIGDDGRPRVAFSGGGSVGYAVVAASGRLKTSTIFSADDVAIGSPVLVLGADDRAFVSWAAWPLPECGAPEPTHHGTWFATDVDGTWAVKRLSTDIGAASLVVDVATGRLHATYNDGRGVRYVTRAADGTWSGGRPDILDGFGSLVLRRDPASGLLLLVGSTTDADGGTTISSVTAP